MVCAKFTSIQFETPTKGLGTQPPWMEGAHCICHSGPGSIFASR